MNITLALGGGGSKGNSHIGVIRRLEQEGFRIKAIAGTSFGGIVAVFYALGYSPDEIEEIFAARDQTQLYGHAPNDGASLLGLAGTASWLEDVIGEHTFDDLQLPCILTAADLNSGREVLRVPRGCHSLNHCIARHTSCASHWRSGTRGW